MNKVCNMLNTHLPLFRSLFFINKDKAKRFNNYSLFIRHSSFQRATSLSWYDWPFLLQPAFLACKQSHVKPRKECRIRYLPDRCHPDPPARSFLQRVLRFSICACCMVSRFFTLRLRGIWESHYCRVWVGLCVLNSSFVQGVKAWAIILIFSLLSDCYKSVAMFETRGQASSCGPHAIHENVMI